MMTEQLWRLRAFSSLTDHHICAQQHRCPACNSLLLFPTAPAGPAIQSAPNFPPLEASKSDVGDSEAGRVSGEEGRETESEASRAATRAQTAPGARWQVCPDQADVHVALGFQSAGREGCS